MRRGTLVGGLVASVVIAGAAWRAADGRSWSAPTASPIRASSDDGAPEMVAAIVDADLRPPAERGRIAGSIPIARRDGTPTDRRLVMALYRPGAADCRVAVYVSAERSLRYGGSGVWSWGCPARSRLALSISGGRTGSWSYAAGLVSAGAERLRVTFDRGERATYRLRGPVVPRLGRRVFLLDLRDSVPTRYELLDGQTVIARQ